MNPFEIRTDMLKIAQSYLEKQQALNEEIAKKTFDELVVTGQKVQSEYANFMPKMYSFEEILKKAEELYSFVSDSSNKKKK